MTKHLTRLFILLLAALCLCLCASAEPRYPSRNGAMTDAAGVFSHTTLEDLGTLAKRLNRADAIRLTVVTVDFLDGSNAEDYAAELFKRWRLGSNDLLLLLAVGEDVYAVEAGRSVEKLMAETLQYKLLAENLSDRFLAQEYDAAIAAYAKALVTQINKVCRTSVRTDDLFRRSVGSIFNEWATNLSQAAQSAVSDASSFFTSGNRSSGFSFLKVLLAIVLLLIIFSARRSKGFPFGKLLAGLALFQVWKKR